MTHDDQAMEYLFSYGTLRSEEVQLATFGRKLDGQTDVLPGYVLVTIVVHDEAFVARSGAAQQRNLDFTGNAKDLVAGTVFKLTQKELQQADAYEPNGYERVLVQLKSGINAWIYLATNNSNA